MALTTVQQTNSFEVWLKAYTTISELLNENFDVTLDGSDNYIADSLAVKNALRDKIATVLRLELAGIFADSTAHSYVGQFFDEKATFEAGVVDNDLVYYNGINYGKADAADLDKKNVIGVADVTNSKVISSGFVNVGGSIAANKPVYLSSTTPGEFTDLPTSVSVGVSLGAGLILLGTVGGSGGGSESTFLRYKYTCTQDQTTFSGEDDYNNLMNYTPGLIQVFVNGILLSDSDYTANTGAAVEMTLGLDLNDVVEVFSVSADTVPPLAVTRFQKTLTASEVLVEDIRLTQNNSQIWLNGLKLNPSTDYDDTISGQITLTGMTIEEGDIVDVQIFTEEPVVYSGALTLLDDVPTSYSGKGKQPVYVTADETGIEFGNNWSTLADNYNFTSGILNKIFIDSTSKTFAVTLEATPDDGFELELIDIGENLETNNVTIVNNGNDIEGVDENLILDINKMKIKLVFVNSTIGWKILTL